MRHVPTMAAAIGVMVAAAFLLSAPRAHAAEGQPRLTVRPTGTPPKIDGVLDDVAWRDAAHRDDLRTVLPEENQTPTERTEFWVTYDADNLYVAIRNHDSAGLAGIRAFSMQRDQDNGSDDIVRVVLDTFNRQSDGYYFALTAAGGKHDGLIQNKEEANDQWDAIWVGKVTRDAGGWSAEFAIPVKSLSFDPANAAWGFNVARAVRRKQEVMRWSGTLRSKGTVALPYLGEIHGLTGLRQGRGLDLKPFASLTHRSHPAPDEKELELKPGLDVVWHVTPSLAATLTVNTDFADAEVDERQVNLGRFSLFFPEKRGFFTQDASLFTFAGIREDPLPFFSRRIGLADDGTKVGLLGGAKLTGRAGPWTLGLLDTQIESHGGIDSKNLLVGRVARQVGDESSAGLIFTHGDPRTNGESSLVGADYNFINSHLAGSKSLVVRTALQATDSAVNHGTGTAATLLVDFPNEPFAAQLFLSRIDKNYDPALGFVPRTDMRDHHLSTRYRWYFDRTFVRRLDTLFDADIVTDLHGRRLDRSIWFPAIEGETVHGDFFTAWLLERRERLDVPFEIRPGNVIAAGDYAWHQGRVRLESILSRPFNAAVQWQHGGFYGGTRDDYDGELGWRPSHHLELGVKYGLRVIALPGGDFTVRLGTAKAVYTFTPDLQLSVIGQYDNLSDQLGVNFRLKWIVQPGNELFFVVNQGYDTALDSFRPTANETSLKGAWTIRF